MIPASEHGTLPLVPIERPRGIFVRFLYWATRRRYGLTPTAFRVLYARSAWIGVVSIFIALGLEFRLRIQQDLRFLLQMAMSQQHGCTFCADLQLAEAARAKVGPERFRDLDAFEQSERFDAREKAALRYVAALSRSLHVPDAVWEALRANFSERECTDIVWVCAVERYYNSMALPLRIGSDHLSERIG